MKENYRKILTIIVILVVTICSVVYAGTLVKKVYFSCYPITINEEDYASEMPILSYQGRTYVCLREFANMVDVDIDFVNDTIIIETEKFKEESEEKIKVIFEEKTKEETSKESNLEENTDEIVYVSASGEKYHKLKQCNNATYYQITLKEALAKGYTPCARCAI